jgi:RHS repeat-associated protein
MAPRPDGLLIHHLQLTFVRPRDSNETAGTECCRRTARHLTSGFAITPPTDTSTYTHNANGSRSGKTGATWTYGWDRENRLISAGTGLAAVGYSYDALGRRVKRSQISFSTNIQKYTYDGLDVVLDDINGTITKYQNGPGIDDKLKTKTGTTSQYYLQDHLGSRVALTNSSGAITESESYDSFGNRTNTTFSNRYQFTGREYDATTGLQYSRARWYDPQLGRFISEDPIGFAGGEVNSYVYAINDPQDLTDPSGLWPFWPSGKRYPTRGTLPGTNIRYRMDLRQEPRPNMHVYWPDGSETVISHKGGWVPSHGGRPTARPPMSYRPNLRPVVEDFKCRVKIKFPGGLGGVLPLLQLVDGLLDDYDRWTRANQNGNDLN